MKKLLAILSLLLISFWGHSQCEGDCIDADMSFTPNPYYNNSHPDWQVSHGTPSVNPGSIWMWSAIGNGEGINYNSYNFIQGQEYCVTFEATTVVRDEVFANTDAYFTVVATQNSVTSSTDLSGLPPINQVIALENWNATSPPNTSIYSYTFTANEDFNNLWIHPYSPTMPVVELSLRELTICEVTDPCDDVSFSVQLTEQNSNNTAISITPIGVAPGTYTLMTIIENGIVEYYGESVSYFLDPGNYTVCMTVALPDGTKCKKCFDFCIGKWHDGGNNTLSYEVTRSVKKQKEVFKFPDELKEKGIEETLPKNSVRLFPSPTSGKFIIKVEENLQIATIKVYNIISGKSVGELDIKGNTISANLSKENTGIYNVKIELTNGIIINKKIVLNK